MDEQKALHRLVYGSMLTLIIPRDDFAFLMSHVADCEQSWASKTQKEIHVTIKPNDVRELSRIASDLSQQADAQN